jgi:hypothetical protein
LFRLFFVKTPQSLEQKRDSALTLSVRPLKVILNFEHNASTTRPVAGTMGDGEVEVTA